MPRCVQEKLKSVRLFQNILVILWFVCDDNGVKTCCNPLVPILAQIEINLRHLKNFNFIVSSFTRVHKYWLNLNCLLWICRSADERIFNTHTANCTQGHNASTNVKNVHVFIEFYWFSCIWCQYPKIFLSRSDFQIYIMQSFVMTLWFHQTVQA